MPFEGVRSLDVNLFILWSLNIFKHIHTDLQTEFHFYFTFKLGLNQQPMNTAFNPISTVPLHFRAVVFLCSTLHPLFLFFHMWKTLHPVCRDGEQTSQANDEFWGGRKKWDWRTAAALMRIVVTRSHERSSPQTLCVSLPKNPNTLQADRE